MFVVTREDEVRVACEGDVAALHDNGNAWAALLRGSGACMGTELLQDSTHAGHVATIDRSWSEAASLQPPERVITRSTHPAMRRRAANAAAAIS